MTDESKKKVEILRDAAVKKYQEELARKREKLKSVDWSKYRK